MRSPSASSPSSSHRLSWRGSIPSLEPLPIGRSLQEIFSRSVRNLSGSARLLLALMAAEPRVSHAELWQAADRLAIDLDQGASDLSELVDQGAGPASASRCLRSAAYHLTPRSAQRRLHGCWPR